MAKYKARSNFRKKNSAKRKTTLKHANFNKREREGKLREQGGQCCYCFTGLNHKTVTLEHVRARSKGGINHRSNYKASCEACNQLKGNMSEAAFKKKIKHPAVTDPFPYWEAHIRRRLSLATNRSCRNIRCYVGIEVRQRQYADC